MNDEQPSDLTSLIPPEPEDQIKPAVRRFRIRVVFITLACIAVVSTIVGLSVELVVSQNESKKRLIEVALLPQITTYLNGGQCTTPKYDVNGLSVQVLQIADNAVPDESDSFGYRMDGLVLHLIIGNMPGSHIPLVTEGPAGRKPLTINAVAPTELNGPSQYANGSEVLGQPGWSVAEAWVAVASSSGSTLHFEFVDPNGNAIGKLTLDTDKLRGLGSDPSRPNDYVCPSEEPK